MIGKHCKGTTESSFNKALIFNVKKALGKEYKFDVFKVVADKFDGDIKDITLDYILKNYPRKNLQGQSEKAAESTASPVTRIISGGQTGVDTIGLQVAKSLGIETGGTAPKGYLREQGYDSEDISSYGLAEITPEQQADYTGRHPDKRDPYTGRTELNVRNSDGTVYFYTSADKSGMIATKRAADDWGKPFLVNPTAKELREWLETNGIKTLNIAGNRASKLRNPEKISDVIKEALTMPYKKAPLTRKEKISQAIKTYDGKWSREDVHNNPRTLYIFTDNTDRDSGSSRIPDDSWYAKKYGTGHHYPKSTTAKIRGMENAMPVSTVKWFYKNHPGVSYPKTDRTSEALWHDSDKEKFIEVVRQELQAIAERFDTGNYNTIMFPSGDGLFNAEISDISIKRTPELYGALCDLLKEYGFESLIPEEESSKKSAVRTPTPRIKTPQLSSDARWAVKADPESSLEVSSAGDEFGRKFSALNAVLAEGTVITISVGSKKDKKEYTADVGGYSIEAAYQKLKGYERNPKGSLIDSNGNLVKVNGKTIKIDGKGNPPIRDVMKIVSYNRTAATKEMRENYSYQQAYLPLWKLWAKQNPELIAQLKEKAGTDKILTDKFSGNSSVSQARALAEILWGNSSARNLSERNKQQYAEERKQAIIASREIIKSAFEKGAVDKDKIKSISRSTTSDEGVINLSMGLTVQGKQMMEGNKRHPGYMIAFEVETSPLMSMNSMNLSYFFNPFAGERDAIQKFIQWIIPNDPGSLPSEMRSETLDRKRNALRTYLEKEGFTKRTILTDGSQENLQFAYVLRYIIDNFKTLRERYNPINIQEFASLRHNVAVTFEDTAESSSDAILRFAPQEFKGKEELNDENSVRVDRYNSKEKGLPDQYIITFPDSFDAIYTLSQQDRIIKSLAAMTPEGAVVTISPDIASAQALDAFDRVVRYGYDRVATKDVTVEDGSVEKVGIYQRRAYTYSQIEKRENYTPKSVKENYSEEPYFFIFENASIDQLENTAATIPTWHDNKRTESSYLNDEKDFEWFKGHVDKAVAKAIKAIDEGRKVVIPKDPMGSGSSALYHYAPRCYDYVTQSMRELEEYGNRGDAARDYMTSAITTIPAITSDPGENVNLNVAHLRNPRMVLYQKFTNVEIADLSSYYRKVFLDTLKSKLVEIKKQYQDKIANETDKKEKSILQHRLNKLTNPETQYLEALKETTMPEMHRLMRENMERAMSMALKGKASSIGSSGVSLLETSLNTPGLFELIFNYSISLIEDSVGIRITATQTFDEQSNEREARLQAEDVNGEDSPEMGWSYNYRLVDPFKSLTFKVRSIISNVEMRDPDDRRVKLLDSLGRPKTYNSNYLYASIMSRMSQLTMGEAGNFVTMIPVNELDEKEARKFPLGKPVFKILEDMKYQYPWALDIVAQLTGSYNINTLKAQYPGMTVEEIQKDQTIMANLGNTVSQFYTNFCQSFVSYATMVNGRIIEENKAIGAVSLRESAIKNYEGNVRFPKVAMIYNSDSTVNNENIQKQLEETRDILKEFYTYTATGGKEEKKNNPFWNEIRRLQKLVEGGKSLDDVWEMDCSKEQKKFIERVVNVLKASGISFHSFDIFCLAMDNKAKSGITEMLSEYELCLKSVLGLPKGEHIFESSKTTEYQETWTKDRLEYHTPRFYWNKFFEKFGDRVTETELVDSTRILGKSRYSYIYPSYSSMTWENLTNPDLEARRAYIDANYKPYDWFYNKRTGKFKNKMLEDLYNGAAWKTPSQRRYGKGHDMIVKKDGYEELEYQDWSPEDILQLMLTEQNQPTDSTAACYLYPVLSDSQVCKTVQAPKIEIKEAREGMRNVVLQELERMELVEQRNIIFRMQEYSDKIADGISLEGADKAYYDKHLAYYNKYKEQYPERLEEIENYDKNGSKFCFFPELNRYSISLSKADKTGDLLMRQTLQILSSDPNIPVSRSMTLKEVLQALQGITDSTFGERASALGIMMHRSSRKYVSPDEYYNGRIVPITKEVLIESVIENALASVMERKISDFMYKRKPSDTSAGELNDYVLQAVIKTDSSLLAKFNSLPRETENHPLSPAEIDEVNEFNDLVREKVSKFYYAHTYTMSQFLQIMVTDIAFYKNPDSFEGSVDFGKRFKEVAGAGMKLNTNSKFGKKIERNIILKDSVRRSASMATIDQVLQRAVDDGRIIDYEKDVVLNYFKGIKGTDAQAYRSLTSWRDIMDMIGKNDSNIARAIENLRSHRWTMSDFYTVFQTIKPFTFGPEDQMSGVGDIRMRVMVQHKNSEAVLLALYNTLVGSMEGDANYSPRLRGLNRAMEEIKLVDENGEVMKYSTGEEMRAIDVAQYQSAVKVGAQGLVDINYSRKKLKELQGTVIKVEGKNFKIGNDETYYSIAERLGRAADAKAISEEEYNRVMDMLEPDENEVFEIIKQSIYKNGDESLGYNSQVLHSIPYSYYSIQQPTPNHFTDNTDGTFGSQPRHIIMADLPENFHVKINGREYKSREEIRERYSGLLVANLIECYEKEIEPLFNDNIDTKKTAAERLHDRLKPLIENNPKYGSSLLDALEVNEKGEFVLPINSITVAHQLEEVLTSLFKNAIHRQHINGGNVIIAADEGVGYSERLKVRGKKKNGKFTKIEGIECLLPAQAKEMLQPFMKERTREVEDEKGNKETITYWELDPKKLEEAGLEKAIGYRIPTEGLYSIMPLIIRGFLPQQSGSSIVLAQEVTTLTGSDNDVDKLFLMLKRATSVLEKGKNGKKEKKIKAIDYDPNQHPLEMTKLQRDNEIIDIFHAIATHEDMSHLWLSPGNFDNLKLEAQKSKIEKTPYLRDRFLENAGRVDDYEWLADLFEKGANEDVTDLYRKIVRKDVKPGEKKKMLDLIVDFTGTYQRPLSPVYPDTFIKMHQMYMAGVAEKGIYANNTLDHAKLQWANVNLTDSTEFKFNGSRIKKIDERYITKTDNGKKHRHYISKDCAECSAASVDNGKDPQLDDINSNKQTATFFGFLLRLGIGLDGAGALMAQPEVDYAIRTKGSIDGGKLSKAISEIESYLKKKGFDLRDSRFDWQNYNFTVRDWRMNAMTGNHRALIKSDSSAEPIIARLTSLYCTYNLIRNLMAANQDMQDPRTALHYDSPTHAADTELGGTIAQTKTVEELNKRSANAYERSITGEENLVVYNLEKKFAEENPGEEKQLKDLKDLKIEKNRRIYDAIMSSQIPITQAFYTLGIERIRTGFKDQFIFGRQEMQELVDVTWDYMDKMHIRNNETKVKILSQMFKDWTVYRLSKTKLFGDDGNLTFDQKRQYYLYQFPNELMKLKEQIPELNSIEATRNMYVERGIILMHRGPQSTTPSARDFITHSFDRLLSSTDKRVQEVGKKLFMYTYYLNGFDFSYASFGNMMSTMFQTAFPEYVQALRDMNTEVITREDMDNFFNQMLVKRNRNGLLPKISYANDSLRQEGLQKGYNDTGQKYDPEDDIPEYVLDVHINGKNEVKTEVLRLNKAMSEMYKTVIYQPVRSNTAFHYNAAQTLDEMLDVVYDQDIIDRNNNTNVYRRSPEAAQSYNYQNSKDMKEVSTERDANTPEPSANGVERTKAPENANINASHTRDGAPENAEVKNINLNDDVESRESDPEMLEKAAGIVSADEDPFKKFEKLPFTPAIERSLHDTEPAPVDSHTLDMVEGNKIVKENNDGKTVCGINIK